MSTSAAVAERPASSARQLTPLQEVRTQIDNMEGQFKMALPAHVPAERFMRVVMTALGANQDLLTKCSRQSLLAAAMKAAQDGLLPDGRDAALVPFKGQVQYMPMIGGILKKIRNSGELQSISAQVAYERDRFFYRLGDDERIEHEPFLDGDRGKARLVYAIARTKDGGIYREIMTVAEVEKVRAVSKVQNGPWKDWWEEMAKKTVMRRLSKRLPMSTDLDDLMRRDDDLYDLKGAREEAVAANGGKAQSLTGRLDILAGATDREDASREEAAQPQVPEGGGDTRSDPGVMDDASREGDALHAVDQAISTDETSASGPKKAELLKRLSVAAAKGTPALRRALVALSQADRDILSDADHDRLGSSAEAADAANDAAP